MNVEDCGEFQILISADFDGELDQREQVELQRHLGDCPSCRDWRDTCQQLGVQIASVARTRSEFDQPVGLDLSVNGKNHLMTEPDNPISELANPKPIPRQAAKSNGSGRLFLGIAALLLVAIGVSFGVFARRRPASTTFNVEPVALMHALNLQTEQDQQATLRAVDMELRMMKLELKQSTLDPTARAQMETQIDSLLTKTRQLDAATQVLYQGEKP